MTMLVPYHRLATTQSAYTTAFQSEEMKNLEDLGVNGETLPANVWKREHLFACKVHVAPTTADLLPAYENSDISQLKDFDQQVSKFIVGVHVDRFNFLEHNLVHTHGFGLGIVFSALWEVKRKLASSSSSDGSAKHTIHLVRESLRLVLGYSHPRGTNKALEFRVPMKLRFPAGNIEFSAIDDGGLCTKSREHGMENACIAILEAKRLALVHDGQPTVSDESLSQMTCEAILARGTGETLGDSVILIHAAGHHVCFLEFQITGSYMTQLRTGKTPDEPLVVVIGKMLDLDTAEGRRGFVENVQHLIGKAVF